MLDILRSLFSYDFAARALIAGMAMSLCAALFGVVLTLRRYTMLGDGLSHTAFGTVAVAAVMGWSPYWVTLIVTIAASFAILRISSRSVRGGDTAVAVISTGALAIGTVAVSIGDGIGININDYLFGSVLSMGKSDVYITIFLSIIVLAAFLLCHRAIFGITFDEGFCKAIGLNTGLYEKLLAVLTAVTVVIGMKLVGTLLMTNLLIYPAVSSMKLLRSFGRVLICSAVISIVCFLVGISASSAFGTPAGSGVVIANIAVYLIMTILGKLRRIKK